jgi:hypothetical protein
VDLQALLHNKWAWAGVGVAGLAGLVALVRRRSSGSSAAGKDAVGAGNASPAYASGPIGGPFDSTGTDVANWLGNYSGNLQNQLNEYKQSLLDAISGLSAVQPASAPAPTAASSIWIRRPAPQPTPTPSTSTSGTVPWWQRGPVFNG